MSIRKTFALIGALITGSLGLVLIAGSESAQAALMTN